MNFDNRETATILAALRLWQRKAGHLGVTDEIHIATDHGTFEPLDAKEIDNLCEKINFS